MDSYISAYFHDRLSQIAAASSPHTARWTRLDRMYLGWLLSTQDGSGSPEREQRASQHLQALDLCYRASWAFVLAYAEWERATDLPSRYVATGQLDSTWACLISAVENVRELEDT